MELKEYFLLFMSAAVVNNFVLTRFLGLDVFFGVSKNLGASLGMGLVVTVVMTASSWLGWLIYYYLLVPLQLTFLTTIVFVLLIVSWGQLLEMVIKKYAPTLYNIWGIHLVVVASNCILLAAPLISTAEGYGLNETLVFAVSSGVGFALALVFMFSIREKLQYADVSKPLQGLGIAFILAGMLALSFLGFSGMVPM